MKKMMFHCCYSQCKCFCLTVYVATHGLPNWFNDQSVRPGLPFAWLVGIHGQDLARQGHICWRKAGKAFQLPCVQLRLAPWRFESIVPLPGFRFLFDWLSIGFSYFTRWWHLQYFQLKTLHVIIMNELNWRHASGKRRRMSSTLRKLNTSGVEIRLQWLVGHQVMSTTTCDGSLQKWRQADWSAETWVDSLGNYQRGLKEGLLQNCPKKLSSSSSLSSSDGPFRRRKTTLEVSLTTCWNFNLDWMMFAFLVKFWALG